MPKVLRSLRNQTWPTCRRRPVGAGENQDDLRDKSSDFVTPGIHDDVGGRSCSWRCFSSPPTKSGVDASQSLPLDSAWCSVGAGKHLPARGSTAVAAAAAAAEVEALCEGALCRVRGRKRESESDGYGRRRGGRREAGGTDSFNSPNEKEKGKERKGALAFQWRALGWNPPAERSSPALLLEGCWIWKKKKKRSGWAANQAAGRRCTRSVCHRVMHRFRLGGHRRAPQPQLL